MDRDFSHSCSALSHSSSCRQVQHRQQASYVDRKDGSLKGMHLFSINSVNNQILANLSYREETIIINRVIREDPTKSGMYNRQPITPKFIIQATAL